MHYNAGKNMLLNDCFDTTSISFLTACVVICCLGPVYSLCIKGLFLNWSRFELKNTSLNPEGLSAKMSL